jgi:hypothetical protein
VLLAAAEEEEVAKLLASSFGIAINVVVVVEQQR